MLLNIADTFTKYLPELLGKGLEAGVAALIVAVLTAAAVWLLSHTPWNRELTQANWHLNRAETLQKEKQFDSAREEIQKALKILEDARRYKLLGKSYLLLGEIALNTHDSQTAIRSFALCIENVEHTRGEVDASTLHLKLGAAYQQAGQFDDAFTCYDRARRVQEKNDQPTLAETYQRIAELQYSRGYSDSAIEYYLRALPYERRIHDLKSEAGTHAALATIYWDRKRKGEALKQYQAAAELYRTAGDSAVASLVEERIAQLGIQKPAPDSE